MKLFFVPSSLWQALVPFCLVLLLLAVASPASQILRYREQTGDNSFTFSRRTDEDRNSVTVVQDQGDEVYSSVCAQDGTTLAWHYIRRPDTDVRAERIGDRIHFSGRFGGEDLDKSESIDARPWYQPLSFSLQRMVVGDLKTARFWTIRPDTLEILTMQAERAGSEQIPAGAATQAADKVVIRLDGFLSGLWQAEYWFRESDHLFVQYRGIHGPPGTATTRINLIQP